jgi:2-polyprenyl-3-methyl-5-hydroxy-6-metoxy-1,4-benzoquinol methylase
MVLRLEEHFKKQYGKLHGSPKDIRFVIYDEKMWRLCLKNIKQADLVVDYGSGGGTLLYNVAQFSKARLLGIELTELAIMQSKNLISGLNVVKGNIMQNPLRNECIDFAFSTMVIEHVDDKKFVEEVYRTLKPGGYLFVTSVIKTKNAWYFYKNKAGETVLEPSHLKEYKSIQEFESVLKSQGFAIVKSSSPQIRYPLLDPLFKCFVEFIGIKNLIGWKSIEMLRLLTQIPIPGYFAAEVLAKKTK